MIYLWKYLVFIMITEVMSEINVKILIIGEENDNIAATFSNTLTYTEALSNIKITEKVISLERQNEDSTINLVCRELEIGISLLLDFTWTGWKRAKLLAEMVGVPYLRARVTIYPFLRVADDTITSLRSATDAVLFFKNDLEMEQSLYYITEYSYLRVLALNGLNSEIEKAIENLVPMPSFPVIVADTNNVNKIFKQALEADVLKRDDRWNLVFTDFNYENFNRDLLTVSTTLYRMKKEICCKLLELQDSCTCPKNFQVTPEFVRLLSKKLGEVFSEMGKNNSYTEPMKRNCQSDYKESQNTLAAIFYQNMFQDNKNSWIRYSSDTQEMYPPLEVEITLVPSASLSSEGNRELDKVIATWDTEKGLHVSPDYVIKPVKRFFRIGTTVSVPWAYHVKDPETGEIKRDHEGNEIWEGYCIDLIKQLAKDMYFDYEILTSDKHGIRFPNGSWNGLIGDLSAGKTDIVVTALTMTSEREQVIDFVAPYFEQGGFTIVIRKPVRRTSLFKFMTVLRSEVWLSIVASLAVIGILVWFLDKYSPYSAQNNKQLYPYPCRHFTLKESFWFALTSFTPHGGGEAPKALSGRTLVAAYWLFVVLMLATFTANLAAFLAVERMQLSVQSLDQLVKQSKINYTVVANHAAHKYFQNMKNAEDILYKMWKEITLNNSNFQTQFRVWDYPVNEQYGHILQAIERTGPVPNSSVGFQKVLDSEEGEFAFIHDSAEIRFRISQNCNLTEIGHLFAEQPFAVAVQLSSELGGEISRRILDLQKDRYFEVLNAKYWNSSNKGICHNFDDYEGISLESLGGVIIATLFGLVLAMITLFAEIVYHKRKKNKNDNHQNEDNIQLDILSAREFGASIKRRSHIIKPNVKYISVFPHSQLY
ncbi:ionotropic receptor 25a-like [Lycorma delicatula]|uniref:ionotropic receptor 25a-like n=1 Tax=Lycorma delicatula TaxID=130591 RepID=UPI003F514A5F